ncbi:MAG: hypothetical protein FWE88_01085 [Phycisphaerae bacterium]|nr:hypothetical protein [Phycisphaerae bacterium]
MSPLREQHVKLNATFGQDAGVGVPLSYGDAMGEACELLGRAGLADVSHGGRIRLRGDDALGLLERLCTHDVARQEDDTAAATLLCNERGGIVTTARLLRLEDDWLLLTPAVTREKTLAHLREHQAGRSVKIDDHTSKTAELLLAGPAAAEILDAVLPFRISDLADGGVKCGSVLIAKYTAVRVDLGAIWCGRVVLPSLLAGQAWNYMTTRAKGKPVRPVGQAALNAIRVEQNLPRYGYEINETIDPATAGLLDRVSARQDFLGGAALAALANRGPSRRRVRLTLATTEPAIPRMGDAVLNADTAEIGAVTSGTWSPTHQCPIALAYIATSHDDEKVFVQLAGTRVAATVR